jgi:hypothetical protein
LGVGSLGGRFLGRGRRWLGRGPWLFKVVSRASDLGALRVSLIAPNHNQKKKKKKKFKVTVNSVKCVNLTYKYMMFMDIIFYTTSRSFTK